MLRAVSEARVIDSLPPLEPELGHIGVAVGRLNPETRLHRNRGSSPVPVKPRPGSLREVINNRSDHPGAWSLRSGKSPD
jgi:hypothetical protein